MNPPKNEKFKPFVPGAITQPPSQSNDINGNELQKMITDSSKKKIKGGSKAETMREAESTPDH